jgi:flagellar motor switch protein FliM
MAERQNLLTPEELDALSSRVQDGSIEVDTGLNLGTKVVKHDLASEDSSLGVNVSSLDMINERFIRMFRLGLLELLRTSPRINPGRVQIVKFGDYLKTLRPPLSVNVVRMNPLRGFSMVILEPSVIFSALDNFFGGFGRGVGQLPPGRLFTPTETRIINMMLDVLFKSMREAWSPVMPVEFEHVSSEINPQFAQIADENDLVVLSRFESEPGNDGQGSVDVVYPYSSLKPIRDLLRSRVQSGDGNEESDKQWRGELASAVGDAVLELKVQLARVQVPLRDFVEFKAGDVIYFRKPDLARVLINEMPVFEAEVGKTGPNVGIRMQRSIMPQN